MKRLLALLLMCVVALELVVFVGLGRDKTAYI
jgi:hypothetical protein